MGMQNMLPYLAATATSFLVSVLLVWSQRWHGHLSMDGLFGVQKVHTEPTPRIGGVALALGLVVVYLQATGPVQQILGPMLLASVPAFAAGLVEDLTKRVGVLPRLLATMFSGGLAWWLTGVAMQDTGVLPLDSLLNYTPLAVLFTAFAVGGVANAVNIIDGFNGLAAGSVAIMLGALGLMALRVGDPTLATLCFLLVAVVVGFGLVNWPFGKLFLGDSGAYLLGFLLGWVAVLLPMRTPGVNAWATMLVCAYPVLEVAFSVRRRRKRAGHADQPDRMHLHHLLHRRAICQWFPGLGRNLKNAYTSPLCWLFTAAPAAWAIVFAKNTPLLIFGFCAVVFAYAAFYARLTQFRWCFSACTLNPAPKRMSL
jgi:UDP-N-acetylmuramyl pentapeptide phosphotransferase/UDP-N-acetylglucosamine-1-phosphate transferase